MGKGLGRDEGVFSKHFDILWGSLTWGDLGTGNLGGEWEGKGRTRRGKRLTLTFASSVMAPTLGENESLFVCLCFVK